MSVFFIHCTLNVSETAFGYYYVRLREHRDVAAANTEAGENVDESDV